MDHHSMELKSPSYTAAVGGNNTLFSQDITQISDSKPPPAALPANTRQSSRKRTSTERGAEFKKNSNLNKKQKIEQDKAVVGTLGTAGGKKQLPSMQIPTRIGKPSAVEVESREQPASTEKKKREPKKQSMYSWNRPGDQPIIERVRSALDKKSDSDEESDSYEHVPANIRRMRAWSNSDEGPMFPGLVALRKGSSNDV